jgi:hypothetical protein
MEKFNTSRKDNGEQAENHIPLKASIPVFITKKLRGQLIDLGSTDKEIDALKPQEAWDLLKNKQEAKDKTQKSSKDESHLEDTDIDTEFLENRITEARDFINKSADNMSVRALMNEFALDEETAKGYLIKALDIKTKNTDTRETDISKIDEKKDKIIKDDRQETEEEVKEEKIILDEEQLTKIKTAFDTPGFLEFLSKNPDAEFDISNTKNSEKVLTIYEAFIAREKVSEGIKTTIAEEFNRVIGIGDTESLSSVDDYLNSQSYENPEAILEFKKQIDALNSGKQEISDLQKQITEKTAELPLGKITTQEEADLELINTIAEASFLGPVAKKIINQFANTGAMIEPFVKKDENKEKITFGDAIIGVGAGLKLIFIDVPYTLYQLSRVNSKENSTARNSAREKIEKISGEKYSSMAVGKYAEKILEQKEKSSEIYTIGKRLEGETAFYEISKSLIARELINKTGAIEGARNKIKSTIGEIFSSKMTDLSSTEKAQSLLERVQEIMTVSSGSDVSLDFLNETEEKELQEIIDKKAQEIIFNEFAKAFKNSKGVDGKISSIENSLKSILEKTKIGSLEGSVMRLTIKQSLIKVINHYKDPIVTTRVKAFMLVNKL